MITIMLTVFAQVPQKMSYQAVIRNSSGNLVTNHTVGMKISILQGSASGTAVYIETQTATTNLNGLVSIDIGSGTVISGTFPGIDWATVTYFLKIESDPAGGTNYTTSGTSQLLSVPYAFYSKTAAVSADAVKLTGDQTIAGNKTFTGMVTVPSPVNATDAVTKAYVDQLLERIKLLEGSVARDFDGNIYNTVEIGNLIWMTENLRTTHYKDGTAIPLVINSGEWFKVEGAHYCWYNNDEPTYKILYGALYNWYAVNSEKLCPSGWHVATDEDWTSLTSLAGGGNVAGGVLKEAGTTHWQIPNTGATNQLGFTALPGGGRSGLNGAFGYIRSDGNWWSATAYSTTNSYFHSMTYDNARIIRQNADKKFGYSVRCVKN